MKEFIEKLIGRLEENTIYDKQAIRFMTKYGRGIGFISKRKTIEIVNQLAEEYKHCTLCYLQSPCEYQNEDAKLQDELLADMKEV